MEHFPHSEITLLLKRAAHGQADARDRVFTLLYDELRALARGMMQHEAPGKTLQPTALVHEAYLRLLGAGTFESRRHFLNTASLAMREVLVDQARARKAAKRGGGRKRESLDSIDWPVLREFTWDQIEEVVTLVDALRDHDLRAHEVFTLRYYNGMTLEQIADVVRVSLATVKNELKWAVPWVHSKIAR